MSCDPAVEGALLGVYVTGWLSRVVVDGYHGLPQPTDRPEGEGNNGGEMATWPYLRCQKLPRFCSSLFLK